MRARVIQTCSGMYADSCVTNGGGWDYDWKAEEAKRRKKEEAVMQRLEQMTEGEREEFKQTHFYKKAAVDPASLPSWTDCPLSRAGEGPVEHTGRDSITVTKRDMEPRFHRCDRANGIVRLFQGDITNLRADGIVNAANDRLANGGGICGAIHDAAGVLLEEECEGISTDDPYTRCETGNTVVTGGYRLPAKHVFHTVGPTTEDHAALRSCYKTTLDTAAERGLKSIGLCCVSTGIFGFPLLAATHTALDTVRTWIEEHGDKIPCIVFCVFQAKEVGVYNRLLRSYFPKQDDPELASGQPKPTLPTPQEKLMEEKKAARAQGRGLWEYQGKGGMWFLYQPDDEKRLEAAFSSGKRVFESRVMGAQTFNTYRDTIRYEFGLNEEGDVVAIQVNTYYRDSYMRVRRVPFSDEEKKCAEETKAAAAKEAEAAAAAGGGVAVWEYKDDDGTWRPFKEMDTIIIESAFLGPDKIFETTEIGRNTFNYQGLKYIYDFAAMTQMNEYLRRPRLIRRNGGESPPVAKTPTAKSAESPAPPVAKQSEPAEGPATWQYMEDDGSWRPFNNVDGAIIEKAYQSPSRVFKTKDVGRGTFNRYQDQYVYDFDKMTQTNSYMKCPRNIRRA